MGDRSEGPGGLGSVAKSPSYHFREEIKETILPQIEKLLQKYKLTEDYDLIVKISDGKPAAIFFYKAHSDWGEEETTEIGKFLLPPEDPPTRPEEV
jgi:hypothetical protein